ncbi:BREX-1 system adenine-specific DNA-methyltransferase PglX, partial [Salmonella enterica]|nr:BREX-1 system adenine-specific DNA-methyltransferase PglX [Salmonella enterica]
FDVGGSSAFPKDSVYFTTAGFLCSRVAYEFLKVLNPTLNFQVINLNSLPWISPKEKSSSIEKIVSRLVEISKVDWDLSEISWDFCRNKLVSYAIGSKEISHAYNKYIIFCQSMTSEMLQLEEENNRIFINIYDLDSIIKPEVPINEITLNVNPNYRYNSIDLDNINERFQSETLTEAISYIIGCMMGRYSLDREGLVYAHEGNKGFAELVAEGAYKTFPADNDGILPLMDDEWFDDDVTSRVKEFVRTVWGEEHLQENLEFIAESLCLYAIKPKKGESALDTIRRYLSTQFWKDHMKMYKKRPIYWLFSSGKEKAFECLVYLHRYHDATLARMRTEYVVPLLARYQANIDRLNEQVDGASGGEATRLKRERDSLSKKFNELRSFDDRLRHYADMRISIDLDDGVKVNYGKFGDLLADVKAITGNAPEII